MRDSDNEEEDVSNEKKKKLPLNGRKGKGKTPIAETLEQSSDSGREFFIYEATFYEPKNYQILHSWREEIHSNARHDPSRIPDPTQTLVATQPV